MTELVYFPAITAVEERLDFATAVFSARAGEAAHTVRELPRLSLTYKYSTLQTLLDFKALAEKIGSSLCRMPYWLSYGIAQGLIAGSSSITLEIDYLRFPVDTKEILIYENLNKWELVEVSAFSSGILTLNTPLIQDYSKVYIVPVLQGYILEGVKFTENSAEVSFQTDYCNPLSESFLTFNGIPVCPFKFEKTSVEHRVMRKTEVFDTISGQTEPLDVELYDRLPHSGNLIAIGRTQINSLRNFLTFLEGKKVQFYLSMGFPDLEPRDTELLLGATYLDVEKSKRLPSEKVLAIKNLTETVYVNVNFLEQVSPTITRVHFSEPMPAGISNIKGLEFLNLVRSDTDSFTISHKSKWLALVGLPVITTKPLVYSGVSPVADWQLVHDLEFTDSDFRNYATPDAGNYWNITVWTGVPSYVPNNSGGFAVTGCTFYLSPVLETSKFAAVEFSVLTTVYDSLLVEGTSAGEYIYITAEGFLKVESTVTTETLTLNTYYTFLFKQTGANSVEIYLKKAGSFTLLMTSANEMLVRGNLEFNSPWGRDVLSERIDFVKLYIKNN